MYACNLIFLPLEFNNFFLFDKGLEEINQYLAKDRELEQPLSIWKDQPSTSKVPPLPTLEPQQQSHDCSSDDYQPEEENESESSDSDSECEEDSEHKTAKE